MKSWRQKTIGLTCWDHFTMFFFSKCVDAVKCFFRCVCFTVDMASASASPPLTLLLLAQPEPGPQARASRAPGQASSPWSEPAAFLRCLLRESRKENLERDPPKGFHFQFTQHSSRELPPLCPTLYLTLTICWVSAKNPIRLIWNSPGERTLSFWRTDN